MINLLNLISYAVTLFGVCFIIGFSEISFPIRSWMKTYVILRWPLKLIQCPACSSFWIGLFMGIFYKMYALELGFHSPFTLALFSCGSSCIIGLLTGLIE